MANIGDLRIEIEAIDRASATLNKVGANLRQFSATAMAQSGSLNKLSGSLDNVGKSSGRIGAYSTVNSKGFTRMGIAASGAFIGISLLIGGVKMLAQSMVTSASNLEQNRVAFETMLGSAEQASIMMRKLSEFAMKTPFTLPEVQEGAKQLLAYNISAEKIIPTFEALGNIAAGVGKDKMPQLVLAYGQVRAATKLTGQELRQFTEAGVPLLEVLAKQSGKSAAEVKQAMEDGAAPSFQEVEKAIFSLSQEGGKSENLMGKQAKTLSGVFSNLLDNFTRIGAAIVGVSVDGQVAGGSLYETLQKILNNMVNFLNDNGGKIVTYGRAIIATFSAIGVSLYNGLKTIAVLIVTPFKIAVEEAQNSMNQLKSLVTGGGVDLSSGWDIMMQNIRDAGTVISDNGQAIEDAWKGAWDAAQPMNLNLTTLGDLAKTSDMYANSLNDVGKGAKSAAKELENLTEKVEDAHDAIKKEDKEYKKSKKELKKDYKEDLKDMEADLRETLAKMQSDFNKEMAKMREDYNKDMLDLREQLREDLEKIDQEFNKNEEKEEKSFREDIAGIIYNKEEEIKKLQEEMKHEESSEKRWEMAQQIKDIEKFLETHKDDVETYGEELEAIRKFQALDEIDQIKFKNDEAKAERLRAYKEERAERLARYAEEKADRIAKYEEEKIEAAKELAEERATELKEYKKDLKERKERYEDELDDLKDQHKEKEKELEKHLKKLKKELEEFLNSEEYRKAKAYLAGGEYYGKRATGGLVTRGKPYLVGEQGPEMIVPASSGRVVPAQNLKAASEAGGNSVTVNVDVGMYAGSYTEKRKLGEEILRAINQTRLARGLAPLN